MYKRQIVRKLGVPGHEEFAMGALASGDVSVLDEALIERLAIDARALQRVVDRERDELERAFAEAEAEVDQMRDVNEVAERVLLGEPVGVVDLLDEDLLDPEPGRAGPSMFDPDPPGPDAAWAEQAVWPEPVPEDPRRFEEGALALSQEQKLEPEVRGRPQGLKTLERWLGKLERKRMRGSR